VGEVLATQPLPVGNRVGLVGNASALVTLARGAVLRAGLSAPADSRVVPTGADPDDLEDAVRSTLDDESVDAVLVVIAPPLPGVDVVYESAAAAAATGADKPVVAVFVGSTWSAAGPLRDAGVPTFGTVEEAVAALARVSRYAAWRRVPAGAPPELSDVDISAARSVLARRGSAAELLRTYGISTVSSRPVTSEASAVSAAEEIGYPVAVKTAFTGLRARIDLGALRLDVNDERGVRAAYEEVSTRFGPEVLVQAMAPPGVACVIEVVDDPAFGPVVGFGLGGLATELLGDRIWRAAPLTDIDAAALVREPRAAALLHGYLGTPPVDVAALVDLLLRVGEMVDEHPEIKRLQLNPVLARADGLSVLHAEVSYGDPIPRPDTGPRRL
jgi:acyl-CoA synthetase (NDP forming)